MTALADDIAGVRTLVMVRGSTEKVECHLSNGAGTYRDITGRTRVRVAIATAPSGTKVLERDTDTDGDTNITVADSPAVVTIYPTQKEADELPLGVLHADVWVYINDRWRPSVRFEVIVQEGVAEPA